MKTFFEYVMTVPLPRARSSVAALSKSARGACAASRRAASRVIGWTVVCICEPAGVRKEFNTQLTECTENAERRSLAEEVFCGGADDARGGFECGLVTIAANEDNGKTCGLAHEEAGGGGEFIGDGKNGGGERLAVAIARAAQIMEDGNAGRADGYVCQPKAPGTAEGVADDDGNALAGSFAERDSEIFCRLVGIPREQGHGVVARNVRMIHARVGTDVAVACFGNQYRIAADETPRFIQDYFHEPRIPFLPFGDGLSLGRRLDRGQPDHRAFGLRNNLLRDDENVAVFELQARFAGGICYLPGEIVATVDLRQSGQAKQAHIRIGSRGLLRRRAGYGTLGHERGIEILRDTAKAFICKTKTPTLQNRGWGTPRPFNCEKQEARKTKRALAEKQTPVRDSTRS